MAASSMFIGNRKGNIIGLESMLIIFAQFSGSESTEAKWLLSLNTMRRYD